MKPPDSSEDNRGGLEKYVGTCPVCEKPKLGVDRNPNPPPTWKIHCFVCTANGLRRGDYLSALLDALRAEPNQRGNLLDLGPAFPGLEPYLSGRPQSRNGVPEPLPSLGALAGWASSLFASAEPLAYLRERRGLVTGVLRRYVVGWDRDGGDLTFPAVSPSGEIVNLYRRKPIDGANLRALRGRPRAPYPDLPSSGPLLLVAGELDALSGRQLGLPTVTVSGASLPEHTKPPFRGRRVAVLFDAGPEEAAEKVSDRLNAAGGAAWPVRLSKLGLPDDYDLNDWLVDGNSRNDLVRFIKQERRRPS